MMPFGRRQLRANDRRDALVAHVGVTEVALQDLAEPAEVLVQERVVEPELGLERRHLRRGRVNPEE